MSPKRQPKGYILIFSPRDFDGRRSTSVPLTGTRSTENVYIILSLQCLTLLKGTMKHQKSGSKLHSLFSRLSTRDQAKGRAQERTKKGGEFLAPPSKLDGPTIAPDLTSLQPQRRPRVLWDDAFDAVSSSSSSGDLKDFARVVREDVEQQSIIISGRQDPNLKASPELQICRDVLLVAQAQQTKHKEMQWSVSPTRKVDIGQIYGQVASCVQKFVGVGDNIAQFDPMHFALPWAAVRLILTVRESAEHHVGSKR